MKRDSGNLRANMFIYKMLAEGSGESRVVLANEGDEGLYNRANRSLYHFTENSMGIAIGITLNSYVFPLPTFIITCIFVIGRIVYQVGYTTGYGKHAIGFVIASLCENTLKGLLLIIGFKAFGS